MRFLLPLIFVASLAKAQYKIVETTLLESAENAPEAHASTIVEVDNGEILAAWFSGEYEGHEDVGISLARYKNKKWESGVKVASAEVVDGKKYPCWNPVLLRNSLGKILLFYKVGPNPREWWGQLITSTDNGKTWSKPEKLPAGFLGPIRAKSIRLPYPSFLHPSSYENPKDDYWTIHFEISDEDGKDWKKIEVDNGKYQAIQPTLLYLPDMKILSLSRSRHNKVIASISEDLGHSWGELFLTDLPNPNAGIDAVYVDENDYLMVYNPLLAGKEWWEGRNKILLGHSTDGLNWKEVITLEDKEKGEYSYPAIILAEDGKIHITYTDDRKKIKHVVVEKTR